MSVSVVVPVRNGGTLFHHLCSSLARTRDTHDLDVVIIDSGSTDDTVATARAHDFRVHAIDPSDFGHGRTRNLGVRLARAETVCFLTHDVLPCTPDWPLRFARALEPAGTAGVYGRQVPRDATAMEMFFVSLNYPDQPLRFEPQPDRHHPRPGRVIFSNAFSAVKREVALRIPFPETIGYSEDLVWAHHVLAAGYSIVYENRAEALHAHHYSLRGLFRRSYLIGSTLHAHGIGGGASFRESLRFLAMELSWFVRQGHTPRLPQLFVYEFMRWAGFQCGRILGGPAERRRIEHGGPTVSDTFGSEPARFR